MTSSGKEPPADERAVGYGKPPVHTRFRKGQSGNPGGRPRGMTAGRTRALVLQEAYRLVNVREGDNVINVPAIQAIVRSQIALAAKGNGPAQRSVIEAVQAIERDNEAQVAAKDKAVATKRPMSELEIGRRLAFVIEMIARGEVGAQVPERDLAGREFEGRALSSAPDKKPSADEHKVGYAKPPVHTRFSKGKSGNPGGRPRGMTAGRTRALVLQEAYRLVNVREGDNVTTVPAIQAIVRSQIALAAKGNGPAQRSVIEAVQAMERENEAQVAAKDKAEAKKPQRSELDIGRRLAFVLELIARGEVKVKMPKGWPLLGGLEVPEPDLAGREFATSQIASPCGSSKVDENREPQVKTEPGVGTGKEEQVPEE